MTTVLDTTTATYLAFKFAPGGTKLTVHTRAQGAARTNVVVELRKESTGVWADWEVLSRPVTADASLVAEDAPGVVSNRALANSFEANHDLWADIDD